MTAFPGKITATKHWVNARCANMNNHLDSLWNQLGSAIPEAVSDDKSHCYNMVNKVQKMCDNLIQSYLIAIHRLVTRLKH